MASGAGRAHGRGVGRVARSTPGVVLALGALLLVPALAYDGVPPGSRSAGRDTVPARCTSPDDDAVPVGQTYMDHSGDTRPRPVDTPVAPQARLTVNKVRAYYRGIGLRDRGQELAAAATCTAGVARDPAAERAVAFYRADLRQRAEALVRQLEQLAASVRAGDRMRARSLYGTALVRWERVRPAAAPTTDLDARTGWRRIGRQLHRDGEMADLAPVADRLVGDARDVQARATTVPMTVVSIGRGAKELFDDDPADAAELRAEVASARTAYGVLRAFVSDPVLVARLDTAFTATRQSLVAGTSGQRELTRVADALAAALSNLAAAV
jgi:hypothetical protein